MPAAHPVERRLLTLEVARRHYVDGWSKKEIGDRLSLSRFQVARMLERALENGWVRIEIQEPADLDLELGDRLRDAFGLRYALVSRADDAVEATRAQTASAAARLLEDVLGPDDLLGLAWSRTVAATVGQLSHVPRIPVVQLNGALPQSEPDGGSIEMVRRFASLSGHSAYLYYAPMVLPDVVTAETLRRQPEIARTVRLAPQVTTAMVAVGAWRAGASTIYDALTRAERAEATDRDVVAEISGIFVDADGNAVDLELSRRMLCPSSTDLRAVDHVIAVAHGPDRGVAVHAALRSGLITSLVTEAGLATALLERVDDTR